MAMYHCFFCGARFEEPNVITRCENLDGERGWWRYTQSLCPECGSDDIDEKEEDDAEF